MAENDFLPFATGGGALVETLAQWTAEPTRLTGFGNGVANPLYANTAWRQSSVVAYVIGQFTADFGFNALDNSDLATFLANYKLAIQQAVVTYSPAYTASLGVARQVNNFVLDINSLPLVGNTVDADLFPVLRTTTNSKVTAAAFVAYVQSKISGNSLWHEGTLNGGPDAFTVTLTPAPTVDAYGINMRVTVQNVNNNAGATLDFGFGPKPLVLNSNNMPVVGGELTQNSAFTADIFYDGTRARIINPAPPVVSIAANVAGYTFPATQPLGNNTTTTISLAGFASPFGSGSATAFTFTKTGIYTVDFQIVLQVNTTENDSPGGSAAQARFYTSLFVRKNGVVIATSTLYGSSNNYIGTNTSSLSYTSVFVAGDTISLFGSGTGDSFNSGGCFLVSPSAINITLVR